MKVEEFPLVSALVPSDPILTVERDENGMPMRYCLDAHTENIMQNQRAVQGLIGVPMIYSAIMLMDPKVEIWKRLSLAVMGGFLVYSNFKTIFFVNKAKNQK